jgi:ABC-type phosphate transport system substrate-binding protein
MSDDFLHRIRIDPPERFIATLKARLDRQQEKSQASPQRTWFRNAFLLTLLGASGLAAALILARIYHQESASSTPPVAQVLQAPVGPNGTSSLTTPSITSAKPASPPVVNLPAAGSFRMAGPSIFQPIVQESARILKRNGPFTEPDFDTKDSTASISALCGEPDTIIVAAKAGAGKALVDAVIVTRRILADELKNCGAHGVTHVAEVKLGYEAVVFARSSLYGAPQLTLQDIFFALTREIPDPENPLRLVKNTNSRWGQVNLSLLDEPIDILGPSANSSAGMSVRELLLVPGCAKFSSLTALKIGDKDPDDACKGLRTDGVYHEAPHDLEGYLEANPEALAIIEYKYFWINRGQLVAASIDGVAPTEATLSDGSYSGARTLYLYVNAGRAGSIPRMRDFTVALLDSVGTNPGSPFMYLNVAERTKSRTAASMLTDVML